jgi:SGNH domain (fused to AT3 domains)
MITVLTRVPQAVSDQGGSELAKLDCQLVICVRHRSADPNGFVIAIIGDSIPRSLDPGLLDIAEARDWTYLVAASDGCRLAHLLTHNEASDKDYRPCYQRTPGLLAGLIDTWHPDLVLAADRFDLMHYVDDSGQIVTAGSREHLDAERSALTDLATTLEAAHVPIAFLEVVPDVHAPECLTDTEVDLTRCTVPASEDPLAASFNEILREVVASRSGDVYLVSLNDVICPDGACAPTHDDVLVQYDGEHFTSSAARVLVPLLFERLEQAGAVPSQ